MKSHIIRDLLKLAATFHVEKLTKLFHAGDNAVMILKADAHNEREQKHTDVSM